MSDTASANGHGLPTGTDTASPGDPATGNGNGSTADSAWTAAGSPQRAESPIEQGSVPSGDQDTGSPGNGKAATPIDQGSVPSDEQSTRSRGNGKAPAPDDRSTPGLGKQAAERDTVSAHPPRTEPAVALESATLAFGDRVLWQELDLSVARGEFIAVLGPNGSGKTSLLRVLLGQLALSTGRARIGGAEPRAGHPDIGYIPQQRTIDAGVQLRGTDLVGLGVDGHRWGLGLRGRAERRRKVAAAIADVGAEKFARAPLESMSGGEQQRLRVAQALVGDPAVLLCDEPLLSLDLANQQLVSGLIDRRRREHGTAVMFVTHEINPILPLVDRVLYLVGGKFRIGTPDEVMTSAVLSELYRTDVDVLRVRGRLVVVGTGDTMDALGTAGAHCHGDPGTPHTPDPAGTDDSGRPARQALI